VSISRKPSRVYRRKRLFESLEDRRLMAVDNPLFRYGDLSFVTDSVNPRSVTFQVQEAFNYGASPAPAVGSTFDASVLNLGDANTLPVQLVVTSVNAAQGYFVGAAQINYTYAGSQSYTAFIAGSGRSTQNGANYRLQTTVQTNSTNDSPTAKIAPVIQVPDNTTSTSLAYLAVDPNTSSLTGSLALLSESALNSNPVGVTPQSGSNSIVFNTSNVTNPVYTVGQLWSTQVTVNDGATKSPMDFTFEIVPTFTSSYLPPNVPTFSPSSVAAQPGAPVQFTVSATDANAGDSVTITPINPPIGMSFVAGGTSSLPTLQANWTPTAEQRGRRYIVAFEARDNASAQLGNAGKPNLTRHGYITVVVNKAPTAVINNQPLSVNEGQTLVLSGSGVDSDGTISTFQWDFDYNGVTFDVNAVGSAPVFSAAGINGPTTRTIGLRVLDNLSQPSAIQTAVVTINNAPPVINTSPGNTSLSEGQTVNYSVTITDVAGETITQLARVFDSQNNVVAQSTMSTLSFSAPDDGIYIARFEATDSDGASSFVERTITVSNAEPAVRFSGSATVNEGNLYTLNLSALDPGSDTINRWVINWGDNSPPQTLAGNPSSVSHSYVDGPQNHVVTASAQDEDGVYTAFPTSGNTMLQVDRGFGDQGEIITAGPLPSGIDKLTDLMVTLGDGSVLVAGYVSQGATTQTVLTRYGANGSLDVAFGTGGRVTISNAFGNFPQSLTLQPDGKIIVAMSQFVLRYNTNGTPDNTFGATSDHSLFLSQIVPQAITVDTAGRIVVAGYQLRTVGGIQTTDFAVARITSAGALDTSFASGAGVAYVDLGSTTTRRRFEQLNDVKTDSSGSIIASGNVDDFSDTGLALNQSDIIVLRFTSTGLLDTNFGVGSSFSATGGTIETVSGAVGIDFGSYEYGYGLVIDGSNRPIVGGNSALARLTSTGALDTAFDGDGKVTVGFSIRDLALDSSGRILLGGSALARYFSNGSPDITFGPGGVYSLVDRSIESLSADSSGRVVVAGYAGNVSSSDMYVGRYSLSGMTVQVLNVPPENAMISGTGSVAEGGTVSLTASATDAAGVFDPLSFAWTITRNAQPFATLAGQNISFTAGDNGAYVASVTISDGDNGSTVATFPINVFNVAPTATLNLPARVNEGTALTAALISPIDVPSDVAAGFSYSFDIGNGFTPFSTTNSASFTPADNGIVNVKGRIRDKDGGVAEYTGSVIVDNVAPSVSFNYQQVPAVEGSTFIFNGTWGEPGAADTLSFLWTAKNSQQQIVASRTNAVFPFTPPDNDTYQITWTVTDDDGGSNSLTIPLVIANTPPVLKITGSAQPIDEGSAYVLNLSSTDVGQDTITHWNVNWGDGSSVETVEGDPDSFSHTYVDGTRRYIVTAYATDEDGTYAVTPVGSIGLEPDSSFGGDGIITAFFATGARKLLVDLPDGKLLVAGVLPGTPAPVIARFLPDGTFDSTFHLVTAPSNYGSEPAALAVDHQGRVLLATSNTVLRYYPNGDPDLTFGRSSDNSAPVPANIVVSALAVEESGKIIVAGSALRQNFFGVQSWDMALVRLHSDFNSFDLAGDWDMSYGPFGAFFDTGMPGSPERRNDRITDITFDAQGNLLVVGSVERVNSQGLAFATEYVLARLLFFAPVLDGQFGGPPSLSRSNEVLEFMPGLTMNDLSDGTDVALSVDVDSHGRIIVAGTSGVVRYTSGGMLDTTFAGDGKLVPSFDTLSAWVDAGDDIVVVGNDANGGQAWRYSDGTAPSSFSFRNLQVSGNNRTVISSEIDSQGRLVLAGRDSDSGGLFIARYRQGLAVDVLNVAPRQVFAGNDASIDEGAPAHFEGTFEDPGNLDLHTYRWQVTKSGQVLAMGHDSDFDFTPTDDGQYTLTFTVTDSDGASSSDTLILTATNRMALAIPDEYSVLENGVLVVNAASGLLHNDDFYSGDQLTISIVTAPQFGVLSVSPNGAFTYTPGVSADVALPDTFVYELRDEDGSSSTATVTIGIVAAVGSGQVIHRANSLLVGGTAAAEWIVLTERNGFLYRNGQNTGYSLEGISEVWAWGRDGDDTIDASGLSMNVVLVGGTGNDTLIGGRGHDLLFGGAGIDHLTGAAGNDFLMGQAGADRIVGSAGNDVLVADEFIDNLSFADAREVLQNWQDAVANGAVESPEVFEGFLADYGDKLTGAAGIDWFIIGERDDITDWRI
jgi:uncharacterized delta-60 repeat protein